MTAILPIIERLCEMPRALTPFRVHVPGLAADERFVHFDFAIDLVEGFSLHRKANAVEHEPRGLLRHTERTMDLVAADPVLRASNHPHGRKPLVQAER
jgi:hypothetical protein